MFYIKWSLCYSYVEELLKCIKGQPHTIAMASGIGSQCVGQAYHVSTAAASH